MSRKELVKLTVTMEADLKEELRETAKAEDRLMADFGRVLIREGLLRRRRKLGKPTAPAVAQPVNA